MDLYQLITEAAGGFAVGYGASLNYKKYQIARDAMEYAKILDEERFKKSIEKSGLTDEKMQKWHEANSRLNILLPCVYAYGFSAVTSLASFTQWRLTDNVLVSVPFAYLGFAAGMIAHKIKSKSFREDIKIAQEMKINPDSIESYLTPDERSTIRESFEDIERSVFEGNFNPLTSKAVFLLYSTITCKNKAYTPLVTQWSLRKLEETISSGQLQRELKRFYESPLPTAESIATANLTTFKFDRPTRVFVREGDKFYSLDVAWQNLRMVEREGEAGVNIFGTPPVIKNLREIPWNPDYKELKTIIDHDGKDSNRIIMAVPENTPMGLKSMILTRTYAEEFAKQMKNKSS